MTLLLSLCLGITTGIAFSSVSEALIAMTGDHSREAALELYSSATSCSERSAALVALARLAHIDGDDASAARLLLRASLLLQPSDPLRGELLLEASSVSPRPNPVLARTLIEASIEGVSPFLLLRLGGASVRRDLSHMLEEGSYLLDDYLAIELADTLVVRYPEEALSALGTIGSDLPAQGENDRIRLLHEACLRSGRADSARAILLEVEAAGDSQLAALMRHDSGIWLHEMGFGGWENEFLRSFDLWPAAHVHDAAFELLASSLMLDSSLCSRVADPFYSGGLWNELYELALIGDAPSHLTYLAARTRDRLGFYDQAILMLEDYLEQWPDGSDAPLATLYLGIDRGRIGEVEEALATLADFEQSWPTNPRVGNLPWYRGSILFDNGFYSESIPHFRETVTRYPYNVTADDAHFYLCLALMNSGQLTEAVAELGSFTRRWTRSVYRDSAIYWLGRLLLEQGDMAGQALLEDLIADSPESFPAGCARQYLGLPVWRPEMTEEPLSDWLERIGRDQPDPPESALRGVALLREDCRRWGVSELRQAEAELGSSAMLAGFYHENQVWERMPSAAWRLWSADPEGSRPRELWEMRYPRAWASLVETVCLEYQFDPLLLWAIMKQESAFQPECFSWAGARGLIQMIPSTSEYVALENGWEEYSPDILYDPGTSIRYGVSYISSVLESFGSVPVTLAGYNGGPHNASRWGGITVSPDMFFSRITYNETKRYTEIVYHNYAVYRSLYGELYSTSGS